MSMSALTSSPSPVASPRASTFHYPPARSRGSSFAPSPKNPVPSKPSPRLAAVSSPRQRAANARPSPSLPQHSHARHSRDHCCESGHQRQSRPRYADAGTQYSPDGYPPTAGNKLAAPELKDPELAGGRKRKEGARSRSPQMSPSAKPGTSATTDPAEPPVRIDPNDPRAQQQGLKGGRGGKNLPERPAGQQADPEEARSTHGHSSAPKRPRAESKAAKTMPRAYESCNPKDLGVLIANMLMELIRLNDQIPLRDGRLTRFHSRAPPGISVADYLQRLIQHATLSPPILLSMVYYIDRLCALYPAFTINSLTVHRFLITAVTVAAKGLSDSFWTNPTYARIGGIPVSELATLELEFLQKVQWKIVPKPESLVDYYNSLVDRTEGFQLEPRSGESSSSSSMMEDASDREDDRMNQDPT
ncbi:hypothetical protein WHR41_03481 [Cladosporium halotolerans]|uniref:Nuc-1 negative regulatory protein preg n=1 Tax=Cladosporium halotolerans TaxID=1052096 RepID=A0AB34KU72_9PEZI